LRYFHDGVTGLESGDLIAPYAPNAAEDRDALDAAEPTVQRLVGEHAEALAAAYRERNHLAAWLAALHPSVIAPAPDAGDGWHRLFLRAGGWQFTWPVAPADLMLFDHVKRVPAGDARARWDGHTTAQKYLRIRTHAAVLCLSDSTST
jgi:hypothetical protein